MKVFHVSTLPQYLSFVRIYPIEPLFQSLLPVFVSQPMSVRKAAISACDQPERYASYINCTIFASGSLIFNGAYLIYLPVTSLGLSYPSRAGVSSFPSLNRCANDQFIASLFLTDSSCANVARNDSINSLFSLSVFTLSVSKYTPTGFARPFSIRIVEIQSTRFLAKRETLLVTIRSYSPRLHASIIAANCSLFFNDVPEIPSSA